MIFVITHRKFDDSILDKEHYNILHVGDNADGMEEYACDNTGDNISHKNPSYCELTGLYWIWKNHPGKDEKDKEEENHPRTDKKDGKDEKDEEEENHLGKNEKNEAAEKDDEIVGLVHYRRYFTTVFREWLYTYFSVKPPILPYRVMERTLDSYDIILPKPDTIIRTVREFYNDIHVSEDMDITRDSIARVCPGYLDSFDMVMNEHYFYFGNMMICKRKHFDAYCEWLFPVLEEIEKNLDPKKHEDKYQSRVIGFIAERLLQVWVEHNGLKVKRYAAFNTESKRLNIFQKNANRFDKLRRKISH